MRTKFIIATICLAPVLLTSSCRISSAPAGPTPLLRAHAHNDYEHDRPLFDALDHGFTSVEADIYLVDGELFVAHNPVEIKPDRTLRSLYLEPLKKRIAQNSGRVYPNGPQFTLFIDIKTEAVATYEVLSEMLAEYESIFTTFDSNGRTDKAVIAIVSGNRPRGLMESEQVRYAGCDGRLVDLESDAPATLIPVISDNWTRHFSYNGNGPMPAGERQKLKKIVETAHQKGRRIRFWSTPDRPTPARQTLWRELLAGGVDLLNTDDLRGLQQFLLQNTPK
ncbi:MAG TPA: phosphatidylinositol-specific phospholipase C/glycerophosphodiester phosphodiesterase family protein [Sedimentisphaerales bacterium]|nr:phosphatidylinositol-specific phospholipase C/glycerophosphodiester phosphodiesterase family protein [Sedimentisphaerales bacterium]